MCEDDFPDPMDALRDRYRGALLGLAVGDALGTTVEFSPPGSFPPVTDMVGGGPFDLPPGAWTDDTAMALCLGESLLARGGFDPVDQLTCYRAWYREGHHSSTGTCFDIGTATRAAIERFERTGEPFPGDAAPDAGGNGPLMKLAPIAMAYANDPASAVTYAGESARTTHGAEAAIDATRYLAALLVQELRAEPLIFEPTHPEVRAVAEGSYRTNPAIRGGGYAVDALEAALWAFHSTGSFAEGVLAAVNLGDDADTTAAICGQLAGAHYGASAIPARWRERVHARDEIVAMADDLLSLAGTIGP
jgi:ADP-ribosylglycohydrolase